MRNDNDSDIAARIRHEADAGPASEGRFTVVVDGVEAELDYRHDDAGLITILHTGVPSAIGGRGIAGELVRATLEWARAEGLKVRLACSYSKAWIAKHPEYASLSV